MSTLWTIAKQDFSYTARSRYVWAGVVLVTAFLVAGWFTTGERFLAPDMNPELVAVIPLWIWTPLIVIGLGYRAIVGERSSGRIRMLLGLPGTRRSVVFGKCVGRFLVLFAALSIVLLVLGVSIVIRLGYINLTSYLGAVLLVYLYGASWLGFTIGVSSSVTTELRSISIVGGFFVLAGPAWNSLVIPFLALIFEGSSDVSSLEIAALESSLDLPTWYLYANRLSPFEAYSEGREYVPALFDSLVTGNPVEAAHAPNVFGLSVLLVYMIVPLAVGYWRFQRVDLV